MRGVVGTLAVQFILVNGLAELIQKRVVNLTQYALLRFVAGIDLAGELGAGITLVAEILRLRSYGSMLVATMGVLGAILAYFVANLFEWRVSYFVGGGLGLLLLVLRVNVFESGMYEHLCTANVQRGNVLTLFTSGVRLRKYVLAIIMGIPL